MFTKVSQLWFEEVSTTGNTNLTLPNFAVKLFKDGNLYNGTTKVESFLDALSSPEKFSARAELKMGKSILKNGPFEVVQLEAIDELNSFMNNYGSNAKPMFDSVNHQGPYYASIINEEFCALSCKQNENRILITKTGKRLETKDFTLPDFLGDESVSSNKVYNSLDENKIKSLCACLSLPFDAYVRKAGKIAEIDSPDAEDEDGIHSIDFSDNFASEEIKRILKNSLKDIKNVKFNKDPLPEKIWMKKKKDSGQEINRFKRERLYRGESLDQIGINFLSAAKNYLNAPKNIKVASVGEPLYKRERLYRGESLDQIGINFLSAAKNYLNAPKNIKVASVGEPMKLNLNNPESLRRDALKLANELLEKRSKTASVKKESYSLFENYGETVKCPNCEMDMVKIRLAGGLSGIYCTTCKHADYDGKIKSRVNAGNPSVEKKITLNCLDSGNCEIKK